MSTHRLLRAGLLGFEAVTLGPLVDYADKMKTYSDRLQAEAHGAPPAEAGARRGASHNHRTRSPSSPSPRNGPETACGLADDFWRKEFEEPTLLILSKAGRLGDMLE